MKLGLTILYRFVLVLQGLGVLIGLIISGFFKGEFSMDDLWAAIIFTSVWVGLLQFVLVVPIKRKLNHSET